MASKFVPVVPKKLNEKAMLEPLRQLAKDEAKFADTQFALTYKTWEHKPSFRQGFMENIRQIEGFTLTSDAGSKDNPYPFVTKGTSVRYALMTPDFSPKTTPRIISSKGGRGGVLFVDKRRPRPGIKAREFEPEIAVREQPKFEKRGEKAMSKVRKVSGHAI